MPQVTGNFACPAWDSILESGERQLAVSGNALDHTAIRAGPKNELKCMVVNDIDVPVYHSFSAARWFRVTYP